MTATLDSYALPGDAYDTSVATLNDGRIVIAYLSSDPYDSTKYAIYYDILSADGATETVGVQVSNADTGNFGPTVTATAGGGFRIGWVEDEDPSGAAQSKFYQSAFTSSGALDPKFYNHTSWSGYSSYTGIQYAELLGLSNGGAVAAVVAASTTASEGTEIVLQFGSAFYHGTTKRTLSTGPIDYDQYSVSMAEMANGNVVIAYISENSSANRESIQTVIFDQYGNEVEAPKIREFFTENEYSGQVAIETLDNGNLLMVWEDGNNMNGRIYAPDMSTVSDFYFAGAQIDIIHDLDIIQLANGELAALWSSPADNYHLHVQRFDGYDGDTIGDREVLGNSPAAFGFYYNYDASYAPMQGGGFLAFDNYYYHSSGAFFGQGTSQQDFAEMWNGNFFDAGLGDDVVNGSTEDDTIIGGQGADNLNGRGGDDNIFLDDPQDPWAYDEGFDRGLGGEGNDRIKNTTGQSFMDGGVGNDVLIGGAGVDTMLGGLGNDILRGRTGNDDLSGGDGLDTLKGGSDNDRLNGGADKDILRGGSGTDLLDGGISNDILNGGADDDTLIGNNGRDLLRGGQGSDLMTGGAGVDTFLFKANDMPEVSDIIAPSAKEVSSLNYYYGEAFVDIITDFGDGNDRIKLVGFDGISAFGDLDLEQSDGQAIITIDDHQIVVNTLGGALDAGDFLFA